MTNPLAWQADLEGYQVIVFLHEAGIFSVLIVRPVEVTELVGLRHEAAFEAACRSIPGLAVWTDPARAEPITPVLAGGRLINRYQGQARPQGVVLVGDAVCTTTPMFGRGLATSMMQARELLRLVDDADGGLPDRDAFEAWCDAHMRPWVDDHVFTDVTMQRLWNGGELDLDAPLPAVFVMAAAEQDPQIRPALGPYLGMLEGPDSLDPVQERAHAVYRSGWFPTPDEGPGRRELCAIVQDALAPA